MTNLALPWKTHHPGRACFRKQPTAKHPVARTGFDTFPRDLTVADAMLWLSTSQHSDNDPEHNRSLCLHDELLTVVRWRY
jgi:hypothetical protein